MRKQIVVLPYEPNNLAHPLEPSLTTGRALTLRTGHNVHPSSGNWQVSEACSDREQQRRLSGTGAADDGEHLASTHGSGHVSYNEPIVVLVMSRRFVPEVADKRWDEDWDWGGDVGAVWWYGDGEVTDMNILILIFF
jgi:hypothetical protein